MMSEILETIGLRKMMRLIRKQDRSLASVVEQMDMGDSFISLHSIIGFLFLFCLKLQIFLSQ